RFAGEGLGKGLEEFHFLVMSSGVETSLIF
ncbi:MAG: hypothetical protein QOI22_1279, partial [Verrucomicrobiota bacterium]